MTGKRNNSQPDNSKVNVDAANAAARAQIQTIMAVVVPVEIFDQMKGAIKRLPYNEIELLLQAMRGLAAQQVNMQLPPGMTAPPAPE